MKEHPILFSAPMVQAILGGRKTMTRRIMKKQPPDESFLLARMIESTSNADRKHEGKLHWIRLNDNKTLIEEDKKEFFNYPYGQVGDRLWVRETHAYRDFDSWICDDKNSVIYKADYEDPAVCARKFKPSIHMPRWASRITLEITKVRIERLQNITDSDAVREGIERVGGEFSCSPWRNYRIGERGEMNMHCSAPTRSFMTLWESIHGVDSWSKNPYVWVIEFRRVL